MLTIRVTLFISVVLNSGLMKYLTLVLWWGLGPSLGYSNDFEAFLVLIVDINLVDAPASNCHQRKQHNCNWNYNSDDESSIIFFFGGLGATVTTNWNFITLHALLWHGDSAKRLHVDCAFEALETDWHRCFIESQRLCEHVSLVCSLLPGFASVGGEGDAVNNIIRGSGTLVQVLNIYTAQELTICVVNW